jgi:alcohol dehydrogenase class IV
VCAEHPQAAVSTFAYDALPGRVVFGVGSARTRLREEIDRLGARRILLIAAQSDLELAQEVAAAAGELVVATFTGVRPHVPVAVAERARALARESSADLLLCVGGGSTTGTAKAVALELGTTILAVPTTYAGSEMTPVWGLTDAKRKTTGRSPEVQPKVVIYDPQLTVTLPAAVTGPSAMNAIAHCVEALYVPAANPVTSLLAREGIGALAAGAPAAVAEPGDLDARTLTLYGAYLAGCAFAAVGGGLHHKICHILGGALDLPHAETHTIVLPHVVAFFAPAIPEVMASVSAALGEEGIDAAAGLYDLARAVGAPAGLRDIGMTSESLEPMIALVAEGTAGGAQAPRAVDAQAVRALLTAAYEGSRPSSSSQENPLP